jgi:hypothetical protein
MCATGRTGDEASGDAFGKVKHVDQPLERHLLEDRDTGRRPVKSGVLVPCNRQPARRHRRGQASADHESEEPGTGNTHRCGRANLVELCEHGGRITPLLRQRHVELREPRDCLGTRRHASIGETLEIVDGATGGVAQQFGHVRWVEGPPKLRSRYRLRPSERCGARKRPVCDVLQAAMSSGEPVATTSPPA